MAIVFPASPTLNDTFTAGFITYKCVQVNPNKWIGLGVTPADRLVEGSNSLEINASNNLVWTGGTTSLNNTSINDQLTVGSGSSANSDYGIIAYADSNSTSNKSSVYARNIGGGRNFTGDNSAGATTFEVYSSGSVVLTQSAASSINSLDTLNSGGGDNVVKVRTQANQGGDPYIKFDGGGSNFVVGEQYNGTTNNQLLMGVGETPTSVVGFGVDGNGKTWSGTHLDGNGQFSIRNNASSRHTSFELSGDNLSNYKMIRASGKYITRGTSERNFDIVNSGDTGTNVNILIEVTFMLNSAVTNHAGSVTARAGYHRSGGGNFTFWTNTPSVSMYNGSGYGAGSISWVGGGTNVKTLRYSTDSNTNYTNYVIKELIVTGYDLAGAVIL
ncbi:hypothetical protein M1M13_gp187 [Synechococcus phage ACG-2014j]|uniref:Uncharacterized protein n=1 Tax=Synechococcus phage ACG-2014j TaxID=1493514 RepID=A0A0E3FJC0_9CAUD|nr:hypothetical protein M1M13_gp187 [Synechococcus phage ACG-2014j]AIX28531.1 hypothetical protein Syn7803US23_187 [Synechococcus phage ACG-2014j]